MAKQRDLACSLHTGSVLILGRPNICIFISPLNAEHERMNERGLVRYFKTSHTASQYETTRA